GAVSPSPRRARRSTTVSSCISLINRTKENNHASTPAVKTCSSIDGWLAPPRFEPGKKSKRSRPRKRRPAVRLFGLLQAARRCAADGPDGLLFLTGAQPLIVALRRELCTSPDKMPRFDERRWPWPLMITAVPQNPPQVARPGPHRASFPAVSSMPL